MTKPVARPLVSMVKKGGPLSGNEHCGGVFLHQLSRGKKAAFGDARPVPRLAVGIRTVPSSSLTPSRTSWDGMTLNEPCGMSEGKSGAFIFKQMHLQKFLRSRPRLIRYKGIKMMRKRKIKRLSLTKEIIEFSVLLFGHSMLIMEKFKRPTTKLGR